MIERKQKIIIMMMIMVVITALKDPLQLKLLYDSMNCNEKETERNKIQEKNK